MSFPSDTVQVAAIVAVGGIIVAMLQRNHNAVNGRMSELLEITRKEAEARGILKEKDFQRDNKETP